MTNGEQVCLPFLDTLTGLLPSLPQSIALRGMINSWVA